jgi:hypothetical protein
VRLYYAFVREPSFFDVTLAPNLNFGLYLDSDGTACPAGGTESRNVTDRILTSAVLMASAAKCKDSSDLKFSGGDQFKEVGTWTVR